MEGPESERLTERGGVGWAGERSRRDERSVRV